MSDTTKALEDLKATHAKMAEEIKALETKIAEEAKVKRPELVKGQIWEFEDGTKYLAVANLGSDTCYLIVVSGPGVIGNHFAGNAGFSNSGRRFTYLGMASDLLTIKEPNK